MRHIYKKENLKEVLFFKDCDAKVKPYEAEQKKQIQVALTLNAHVALLQTTAQVL